MKASLLFALAGAVFSLCLQECRAARATPLCPPFTKYSIDYIDPGLPSHTGYKLTGPNCHLHYFTQAEILKCMANKWLVFVGGSNGCGTSAQLAHYFMNLPHSGSRMDEQRNNRFNSKCSQAQGAHGSAANQIMGWFDFIVLADGTVTDRRAENCVEVVHNRQDNAPLNTAAMNRLKAAMGAAPPLPAGATRVTWVYLVKFPALTDIINQLRDHMPHLPSPTVHTNIGVWYRSIGAFNLGIDNFLSRMQTEQPDAQIVLRDQSYANDAMRASFVTYYNKFKGGPLDLILLHEGQYGPGLNDIWFNWPYGNHPTNPGGQWSAMTHIQAICKGFEEQTPVAFEVLAQPNANIMGSPNSCAWDGFDYYEYVMRDCPAVLQKVGGDDPRPLCPSGQKNLYTWSNAAMAWAGYCESVPCPANAAGEPNCACLAGYTSTLIWNSVGTGAYQGGCVLAPPPPFADQLGPAEWVCLSGYSGTLQWGNNAWQGTCELVLCPEGGGVGPECQCQVGYSGSLAFDEDNRIWVGECLPRLCPAGAISFPNCECAPGHKSTLAWEAAVQQWAGGCAVVACPDSSSTGAPNCKCLRGYRSTLLWDPGTEDYQGGCVLRDCPNGASMSFDQALAVPRPLCACKPGYGGGSITWDGSGSGAWVGGCSEVACPADSALTTVPRGCQCGPGFVGSIVWLPDRQRWGGKCRSAACPAYADGDPCVCEPGSYEANPGTCQLAGCPANSKGLGLLPCACDKGFESSLQWNLASYSGACTIADCLPGGTGAPGCACQRGYTGSQMWNFATAAVSGVGLGAWQGGCQLAVCPAFSSAATSAVDGRHDCVCDTGYDGTLTWDFLSQTWRGACSLLPCPLYSAGAPDCICKQGYSGILSFVDTPGQRAWAGTCAAVPCPPGASGAVGTGECACDVGYNGTVAWDPFPAAAFAGRCDLLPCPSGLSSSPVCACPVGYGGFLSFNKEQQRWQGQCSLAACPISANYSRSPLDGVAVAPDINSPKRCGCNYMYSATVEWEANAAQWLPKQCVKATCPPFSTLVAPPDSRSVNDSDRPMCECLPLHRGYPTWSFAPPGQFEGGCSVVECPVNSSVRFDGTGSGAACQCFTDHEGKLRWHPPSQSYLGSCPQARQLGLYLNNPKVELLFAQAANGGIIQPKGYVSNVEYDGFRVFLLLASLLFCASWFAVPRWRATRKRQLKELQKRVDNEAMEMQAPSAPLSALTTVALPQTIEEEEEEEDDIITLSVNPLATNLSNLTMNPMHALQRSTGPPAAPPPPPRAAQPPPPSPDSPAAGLQPLVRVCTHAFQASIPAQLSLRQGDRLLVTKTKNGWCKGFVLGSPHLSGLFPESYTEPDTAPKPARSPRGIKKKHTNFARRTTRHAGRLSRLSVFGDLGSAMANSRLARATSTFGHKMGFNGEWNWKDEGGDGFGDVGNDDDSTKASFFANPLFEGTNADLRLFAELDSEETSSSTANLAKKKDQPKSGVRLNALGPARFIASVHIVAGHLVSKTVPRVPTWSSTGWGFTWVPWFMMLSAFVLSYARAASSKPAAHQSPVPFVYRRLRSIYPLYLCGLFASAALNAVLGHRAFSLGTPMQAFLSVFLLQAWVPSYTEGVLQAHCWFLSCIIPYWLLHKYLYLWINRFSEKALWSTLIVLTISPWLAVFSGLSTGLPLDWYGADARKADSTIDTLVVMLKFHPVSYLPNYIFGIALGCLFVHLRKRSEHSLPFYIKYGASFSFASLLFIFVLGPFIAPPYYKLSARLGVLAPLHGMLLLGLSGGEDPVSKFLGRKALRFLGDISFPQYIFQFIAYKLWADAAGYQAMTAGFDGFGYWVFLLAVSMAGAIVCSRLTSPKKPLFAKVEGVATALAIPCVFAFLAWAWLASAPPPPPLPARVDYGGGMVDQRLDLYIERWPLPNTTLPPTLLANASSALGLLGTPGEGEGVLINPSILPDLQDSSLLWVAARWHRVGLVNEKGKYPTVDGQGLPVLATLKTTMTWESRLYLGRLNASTMALLEPMRPLHFLPPFASAGQADMAWIPCVPEYGSYFPQNNSVTQVISIGGHEDPRLYYAPSGQLALSFHGLPPVGTPRVEAEVGQTDSTATSVEEGAVELPADACDTRGRVYKALLPKWGALGNETRIPSALLDWERMQPGRTEKNWMAFTVGDGAAQEERFVRTMLPHRVLQQVKEPVNGKFPLEEIESATHPRLLASRGSSVIHGGANAVLFNVSKFSALQTLGFSVGPEELSSFYLGSFHTINGGKYRNYLYAFEHKLPHSIVQISGLLPLLGAPVADKSISSPLAFSSGLSVLPDGVLVVYGSSNAESRVLFLPMFWFHHFFEKND